MNRMKWAAAAFACKVLTLIVAIPALLAMMLMDMVSRGVEHSELRLELAKAEARIRRDRKEFIGRWK